MSPARTATPRRRRTASRPGSRFRRWLRIGIAATLGVGVAIGISRIDFNKALKEITLPLRHDDIIRQQAAEKNLDPALIAAVIYSESHFSGGESPAGAIGLMQITPRTAHAIARISGGTAFVTSDLHDPEINIRYGCFYLRHVLDRYGGNEVAALAAYNAGTGNVDRWGGSDLSLDQIGFPETRAYVDEVLEKRGEYREKYAQDLGLAG
jgi:soluble lytic murein transglycosylase